MNREIFFSLELIEERVATHLKKPGATAVSMRLPLLHDYRVVENIALGRIVRWQQTGGRAEQLARNALAKHGLADLADRLPAALTLRELFTIMLLRALSLPSGSLLLVCPTTDFGLSEAEVTVILAPHVSEIPELHIIELDTGGQLNRADYSVSPASSLARAKGRPAVGGDI